MLPCKKAALCWGAETWGMPCTQCARSAKFWMSANTRTLVLAPFHKFLVPYQGFFWLPKHLGCGIFELSTISP